MAEHHGNAEQWFATLSKDDRLRLLEVVCGELNSRRLAALKKRGRKRDPEAAAQMEDLAFEFLFELLHGEDRVEKRFKPAFAKRVGVKVSALTRAVTARRKMLKGIADELDLPPLREDTTNQELDLILAYFEGGETEALLELNRLLSIHGSAI